MDQAAAATVGDHATAGAIPKRRRIPIASIEDYEETCILGAGSFAVVVKMHHRVTGETVAIKRLRSSDGGKMELLREARFLDACKGLPFLVGYHGLARDRATSDLCLVMEYVGPSLHDYLRERRSRGSPPLPEATVRAVVRQLLTGGQKLHERHIVHRDIKPANILVGDDHQIVKICDLGLAISMSLPPPYTQAGTLSYMAPEVLLGKTDYDALVDTWSLGCVMAELIKGRPLFEGNNDEVGQLYAIFDVLGMPNSKAWPWFTSMPLAAKMQTLQAQRRNRLRELFPEKRLSKEGFEVLNGLLACNPDKRFTAAAALKLPWFSKVDALTLTLPQNEEAAIVSSALPKKKRVLIIPPPLPKRLKVL
ncbi:putative cyclin-dependent kinase F-2 [Phragmites australis]|uniref:putative cyclin-dependent kinase F-2 n=1 Tax=Phragmites australis TaxID=29695 RepID=UPI002D7950E4|nr:putative cyclin-dependent kinase F-2 [Phragmites australis]